MSRRLNACVVSLLSLMVFPEPWAIPNAAYLATSIPSQSGIVAQKRISYTNSPWDAAHGCLIRRTPWKWTFQNDSDITAPTGATVCPQYYTLVEFWIHTKTATSGAPAGGGHMWNMNLRCCPTVESWVSYTANPYPSVNEYFDVTFDGNTVTQSTGGVVTNPYTIGNPP